MSGDDQPNPAKEREMKSIIGAVVVAAVVLTAGVAVAWDGPWMGRGPDRWSGASAGNLKKFQKETLALRDELAAKQVDLAEEYDKAEPDGARIAALRKEIVDIEVKIQASADKHGVRPWGRGYGRGMMGGSSGGGCGCGHCW